MKKQEAKKRRSEKRRLTLQHATDPSNVHFVWSERERERERERTKRKHRENAKANIPIEHHPALLNFGQVIHLVHSTHLSLRKRDTTIRPTGECMTHSIVTLEAINN